MDTLGCSKEDGLWEGGARSSRNLGFKPNHFPDNSSGHAECELQKWRSHVSQ